MLTMQTSVLSAIVEQARREAPVEACGYLGESGGTIVSAYPMRNADASPEHFTFDPAEQFDVVRRIRANGHKAVAVYHSHPETPARPSNEDIRLAFDPTVYYVIVSLSEAEPVVKAFRIRAGTVVEEKIRLVRSNAAHDS